MIKTSHTVKQLPQMRIDNESESYLTTQHVIIWPHLLDGRQAPSYLQDYVYKVALRKCQLQSCGCGELELMSGLCGATDL